MVARFFFGFVGLVVLGLLIIAGVGIWAEHIPGARPEWVQVTMLLVAFAGMLSATAIFIVDRVEKRMSMKKFADYHESVK